MDFRLSEEEEAFQKEVREFLQKEVTPEVVAEYESGDGQGPHAQGVLRRMGKKGWLTPSWPKKWGGRGGSVMETFIVAQEIAYYRLVEFLIAANMVGPVILHYGNEEQKEKYLPRIARGEIDFALGFTEPQAGTDLASVEIRAVRSGDYYIVNGQKLFNTACHWAEYHWLLARTDPNVTKHRGLSIFIVDLKSPGITIRPLRIIDNTRTNEVFYDDVRVPRENLIGEENRGWYYLSEGLDLERLTTFTIAQYRRYFDELVEFCKETKCHGKLLVEDPFVSRRLAELAVDFEVANLLTYQAMWKLSQGMSVSYESGIVKVFNTELAQRLAKIGMTILGLYGQLQRGSKWELMEGRIEHLYRGTIMPLFGAGSNEILRTVTAIRGLGLPR